MNIHNNIVEYGNQVYNCADEIEARILAQCLERCESICTAQGVFEETNVSTVATVVFLPEDLFDALELDYGNTENYDRARSILKIDGEYLIEDIVGESMSEIIPIVLESRGWLDDKE